MRIAEFDTVSRLKPPPENLNDDLPFLARVKGDPPVTVKLDVPGGSSSKLATGVVSLAHRESLQASAMRALTSMFHCTLSKSLAFIFGLIYAGSVHCRNREPDFRQGDAGDKEGCADECRRKVER
eukprot:9072837-Pyramimonas_sp.AAC.1